MMRECVVEHLVFRAARIRLGGRRGCVSRFRYEARKLLFRNQILEMPLSVYNRILCKLILVGAVSTNENRQEDNYRMIAHGAPISDQPSLTTAEFLFD